MFNPCLCLVSYKRICWIIVLWLTFVFIAFASFCQEEFLAMCYKIETIIGGKLNPFGCAHSDCVNELRLPAPCWGDWGMTGLFSTRFVFMNCSNFIWSLPGKTGCCDGRGPTPVLCSLHRQSK